jgi:hypothetical protein
MRIWWISIAWLLVCTGSPAQQDRPRIIEMVSDPEGWIGLRVVGRQQDGPPSVVVSGVTYRLSEDGQGVDKAGHKPLAGVEIQVCRGRAALNKVPHESSRLGRFHFPVKPGTPFLVTFSAGDDHVPELQQLSGKPGVANVVHVVLLTVDQYTELEKKGAISPPLAEKLRCELKAVPQESEIAKRLRGILEKLPKR